jgi:flavin-dependent dehydrogenase
VVGAGISGATCACELHKLGHEVEIFEASTKEKSARPRQMEGSIYLLHNIPEIETDRLMKKIKLHSPNNTAELFGKLGFFYEVGGANGIDAKARVNAENLLPIHYSTKIKRVDQLKKFQVIVAADGYQSSLAKNAGMLYSKSPDTIGTGVGLNVKGDFDPELVEIWLDNYYSSHGYTYVIPFSNREASLVSASIGNKLNLSNYRSRLKDLASSRNWELQDKWIDFESWYTFSSYNQNNLYVVGNAASFVDCAFGFGFKWAIKSAKLCARAIHQNTDYNHSIRQEILPDLDSFKVMRTFFNSAKDSDLDRFVGRFKNPFLKKIAESGHSLFKYRRLMNLIFPKI